MTYSLEYQRNWLKNRAALGICRRCRNKASEGERQCDDCNEQAKVRAKEIRSEALALGQCLSCREAARPGKLRCETCSSRMNVTNAARQRRIKTQVLTRYGWRGELLCCWEKCSVSDLDMLTLDHVNDNGSEHRKEYSKSGRGGGTFLYHSLVKQGFPEGFQTLCANHNLKKHISRLRGT